MADNSIAITGGYVVPIEGDPIDGGTVLLADGKIAAVAGPDFQPPPGTGTVDAAGKWVLPGFIDALQEAVRTAKARAYIGAR